MELARVDIQLAIYYFQQHCLVRASILMLGSVEQQKKYLPILSMDNLTTAWGISQRIQDSTTATESIKFTEAEGQIVIIGKAKFISLGDPELFVLWSKDIQSDRVTGFLISKEQLAGCAISSATFYPGFQDIQEHTVEMTRLTIDKSNKIYFCNSERDFNNGIFRNAYLLFSWLVLGRVMQEYEKIEKQFKSELNKLEEDFNSPGSFERQAAKIMRAQENPEISQAKWAISELTTLLMRLSLLQEKNDISLVQIKQFQLYFRSRVRQISQEHLMLGEKQINSNINNNNNSQESLINSLQLLQQLAITFFDIQKE